MAWRSVRWLQKRGAKLNVVVLQSGAAPELLATVPKNFEVRSIVLSALSYEGLNGCLSSALDEGKPDVVIAFSGGAGTQDMVSRSHRARVPVFHPDHMPELVFDLEPLAS